MDTLKYLKKGGRITPVAAAIGTLLHIKPVLGITNGGKLDSYTKVRTSRQVKDAIIKGLKSELEGRLGDPEMKNCYVAIAYTDNPEQAAERKTKASAERMEGNCREVCSIASIENADASINIMKMKEVGP